MYKFSSNFQFAVSEVDFFTCSTWFSKLSIGIVC
jgi:hypothetical protein